MVKALIVLAVLAALAVFTDRVNVSEFLRAGRDNPYPTSSSMHQPFEEVTAKLKANPKIADRLKGARSGQEAFRVGDRLVQQGISRLDDASLLQLMRLSVDILDKMDDKACGRLLKGSFAGGRQGAAMERLVTGNKSPQFDFLEALEAVGPEKGGAYLELVYLALEKAVEDARAESRLDPSDVQHALFTLLGNRFTPEQRNVILSTLEQGPRAGDEELCLAVRALYANINVTPAPQRRIILRYLATNI
jgi:hypothetical protein